MLPSIIHVAKQFGLEADEKTFDNKEVRFKCPFCPSPSDKYHLSLNKDKNLFKCWKCGESGGVLKFEAMLSNQSFEQVRQKYFGKRKEKIHPAYLLTPQQLKKIGWDNMKQEDFQNFVENKDKVYKEWRKYAYWEYVKHYALLTLIAYFPFKEYQLYHWLSESAQKSGVPNLWEHLIKEYNSKAKKKKWALEGLEVARAVYKYSVKTGDNNFFTSLSNVLVAMELLRLREIQNRRDSVSI